MTEFDLPMCPNEDHPPRVGVFLVVADGQETWPCYGCYWGGSPELPLDEEYADAAE